MARATGPAARRIGRASRRRSRVRGRARTRRCRGAPSRPGPAAPGLSTARTSCRRGAREAVSPARVRSRISSRSNSASAAKMPNTRRPAAVVVSICAPCPVSTRRPTPRVDRSCTVLTRWARVGAAEAVELPDDEHVARPQGAHTAVESRAVVADAGREVVVDVDGVDARGPQGVALQVQRTGSRPPLRRGRSRSACVVNGRLRHAR